MAVIKNKNFSRGLLANFDPQSGDVIESCNLSQMYPNTPIAEGVTGLTFRSCNLVNCVVPADSVLEQCNTTQVSRCGNLHDEYTCAADCSHVVSSEDIIVDGVVVDTIREYADEVL